MRILIILLSCLACADAFAQARPRSGPAPREDAPRRVEEGRPGRSPDNLRERREGLRAFRDEMRQQQEQRRDLRDASPRDDHYEDLRSRDTNGDARNNLRRLSPEDRRRMRQEMRDAFRR